MSFINLISESFSPIVEKKAFSVQSILPKIYPQLTLPRKKSTLSFYEGGGLERTPRYRVVSVKRYFVFAELFDEYRLIFVISADTSS